MKKSYISPETIVIELDAEALCQATVITASLNNTTPEDEPENSEDNQFSASYRSNLWEL